MTNDNIKELIKLEYENGMTMVYLSGKYNISVGTIKTWSFKNKWIKKKPNIKTKTKKKPKQQNQKTNNKDIEIKKDILNDVPREEIMEKHGIKKSAYYVKEKSIRELVKNRNKVIFESVSDRLIADKEERLIRYKIIKLELLDKIEEAMLDNRPENLKQLNDKLNLLAKAEKELYKELRLKVTYEEAEFEKQLAEEETQRNRLEIERSKLKDKVKETENESKSLELLNRLVGEVNGTNE